MSWWQRIATGLLLLAHLALLGGLHYAVPPEYSVVIPAVFGGQCTLLGLWLVCLQDSRPWRVLNVFLAASCLWLSLVIVDGIRGNHKDPLWMHVSLVILGIATALPLSLCGAFLIATWPLSRWQIIPPETRGVGSRQFSIQRIMVGMGVICIFLAVARVALPEVDWRLLTVGNALPSIITGIAILQFIPFLTMLPVIAYVFHAQGKSFPRDWRGVVIGVLLYGSLVVAVETALVAYVGGEDLSVGTDAIAFNVVQLLTIFGTLGLLRMIGFRFERAPRSTKLPPGEGGERLQDAEAASTMAAAGETSPLAIDR